MKYILIILAIIGSSSLFAQSIERQVLGSTGGTATAGSVIVTSTVGEMAVTTGTSTSIILTEGFQQSNSTSSISIEELEIIADYKLFPNPTTDMATLIITANDINTKATVQLYSLAGQLISTQLLNLTSGAESKLKLDVSNQAAGAYFVRITDSNSSLSKSMRLIKQ